MKGWENITGRGRRCIGEGIKKEYIYYQVACSVILIYLVILSVLYKMKFEQKEDTQIDGLFSTQIV